jgi:hypothetical protein
MEPIDMLSRELKLLIRSKEKSIQSFKRGDIKSKLHRTHINNLNPLIDKYQEAINKLKN